MNEGMPERHEVAPTRWNQSEAPVVPASIPSANDFGDVLSVVTRCLLCDVVPDRDDAHEIRFCGASSGSQPLFPR
jgi:hypothetical protein